MLMLRTFPFEGGVLASERAPVRATEEDLDLEESSESIDPMELERDLRENRLIFFNLLVLAREFLGTYSATGKNDSFPE